MASAAVCSDVVALLASDMTACRRYHACRTMRAGRCSQQAALTVSTLVSIL